MKVSQARECSDSWRLFKKSGNQSWRETGATYEREDVSNRFVAAGAACVGWSETQAPPLHNILRHIKIGDIVFLKSFAP